MYEFLAGAVAGGAGMISGHPFDSVKVLMQTNTHLGTWAIFKKVNKQALSTGYFRGLSFPLYSYSIQFSIQFGTESRFRIFLKNNYEYLPPLLRNYTSGCLCFIPAWFVACPIENIKTILQSQITISKEKQKLFFNSPVACAKYLYTAYGIRGLYKGGYMTLFRGMLGCGVYFSCYRYFGSILDNYDINRNLMFCLAGGSAGTLSWLSVMPIDIVKSQIQADFNNKQQSSVVSTIRRIYKALGLKGFFTGSAITCFRGCFSNAILLTVYGNMMRGFKKKDF